MIDEDYQVLLSDGQAFAQLWVLGSEDPPAGGKQKIAHCFSFFFFPSSLVDALIVCIAPRFKLLL